MSSSTNKTNNTIHCCFTEVQVHKEDITCVYEALKHANVNKLLSVLLENQLSWKIKPEELSSSAYQHLLAKVLSMLRVVNNIEPQVGVYPDALIIPTQSFSSKGSRTNIARTISAVMLNTSSYSSHQHMQLDYALSLQAFLKASRNGNTDCCENTNEAVQSLSQLVSKPWGITLGLPVWLPSELTQYERYAVLAHIFWIMTYSGFAEVVFEMKASLANALEYADQNACSLSSFYEEQTMHLARISELLSFNAHVDALSVLPLAKQVA